MVRLIQLAALAAAALAFAGLALVLPILPSLGEALRVTVQLVWSGEIWPHLLVTLYETGVGFAVAVVGGVAIGFLLGSNRLLCEILEPLIVAVYAVPKIVLLPILLAIFGVGLEAKMANAAIHGIFPVILNTAAGVRDVRPVLLKMARSLNASAWQRFAKITFPSMAAPVFCGIRIGLGFAVLGSLLAELFEAKAGLGFLVMHFYNTSQVPKMLAAILFVFLLTIAVDAAMDRAERWLRARNLS